MRTEVEAEMREQLLNPNHCYLDMGNGRLFSHSADRHNPFPWDGTPVRFTHLAGLCMLARFKVMGLENVKMVQV